MIQLHQRVLPSLMKDGTHPIMKLQQRPLLKELYLMALNNLDTKTFNVTRRCLLSSSSRSMICSILLGLMWSRSSKKLAVRSLILALVNTAHHKCQPKSSYQDIRVSNINLMISSSMIRAYSLPYSSRSKEAGWPLIKLLYALVLHGQVEGRTTRWPTWMNCLQTER